MRLARTLLTAAVLGMVARPATPRRPPPAPAGPTIAIGAPDTIEQAIVADLYAQVLRHAGARVTMRIDTGTRQSVERSLAAGQIDLYPDYAGALLLFLDSADAGAATSTATAVPDLKHLLGAAGATVLRPAPVLDTEVFAVTQGTAHRYHLTTLSSLDAVASQLVLGGPPGCQEQPLCLVGLEDTYGLHFKSFTSLDDAGPVTVAALAGGEVQVAELHSSDGTIVEHHFVALTDDKHLLSADYVIPVIRRSVDTKAVAAALDGVSNKLTTGQLSQLNVEVDVDHDAPGAVAQRWLQHEHLI